jgi:hypothetical protein
MKRLAIICVLFSGIAWSQGASNPTISPFAGVPTGTCAAGQLAINSTNGVIYDCVVGTWTAATTNLSGLTPGNIPQSSSATAIANSNPALDNGVTTANTLTYAGTGGIANSDPTHTALISMGHSNTISIDSNFLFGPSPTFSTSGGGYGISPPDHAPTSVGYALTISSLTPVGGLLPTAWTASGGAIYPGAGVANSTGSAWGTSYTVGTAANNLVQLNGSAQLPAVSGVNLTGMTNTQVGLGSVTNNAQTKASIMPNTLPTAGYIPIGNAGGTAYAPLGMTGDCTLASSGVVTCTKTGGVSLGAIATLSILPLADLATQAPDTFVINATAGTASPTAVVLPACAADGTHALTYASHVPACTAITGVGTTATAVQTASEPSTPVVSSFGLNTTYNNLWFVPGLVDNATTPNDLYTPIRYAIDDDSQNLYQLQYTNKAFAGIEKVVAGTNFVWFAAGDSNTSGIVITPSAFIDLTNTLQSNWGYGGPGFLSVNANQNVMPTGILNTTSGTWALCQWVTGSISNGHSGHCWGPDNHDATDASPTIGDYEKWTSSGSSVFTDCFIYYAKQSGGGSFKSDIDGTDGSTVSTAGSGLGSLACPHVTSGTHYLEAIVTTTGSPVTILGAIAVNATGGTGVLVLKAAAASNSAANFATNPNYAALIAQIQTDLSGLSSFTTGITLFSQGWGANEWAQNLTPASMLTAMGTLNSAYVGSGANADSLIITDNDNGSGGTTNTLGDTMWQYDYAHQQFANLNSYAFFSTFRRTYPARTALCGTLHLANISCERMIATQLLSHMIGHTINPITQIGKVYLHGTGILSTPHTVIGTCTIGSTCSVTLTGVEVFSSNTSYVCVTQDHSGCGLTTVCPAVSQTTGAAFAITGNGTDAVGYSCAGN